MSFEDLPADWHRDLSDVDLCDVVDLFLKESDRAAGALLVLLADADRLLLAPMVVDDLPRQLDGPERTAFARQVATVMDHVPGVAHFAFAVGRPGTLFPAEADVDWRRAVLEQCATGSRGCLGVFLATGEGVVALPEPPLRDAASAAA